MKQFIKDQKVTYNLMSYTGYKALVVFALLLESPKTFNEICEYFCQHPYLREKISIDTFRVYMNSLRRIGCEIKRFRDENKESRYVIIKHPFELNINPEQQQSILKVLKSIVKNVKINELLALKSFFEKINYYIDNEDFINEIKKITMLKDINTEILKTLLECCEKKDQIILTYNSPNSGSKDIEIIADKISISNNKIYLYGTGLEYKQYANFAVSRITQIKEIKADKTIPYNLEEIEVVYKLNSTNINLSQNETLIEQDKNYSIIKVVTSNRFLLKQKFLELGPKCIILEPEDFKNEFVTLLNDMKAGYYCG